MDTNSIDNFFHNWYERYNDLMSLPLYITYHNFFRHDSIMRGKDDFCAYSIQSDIPYSDKIRSVCRIAEGALKHLDSKSYNELYDKCKPFEYISYFVYDKIKNIETSNNFQELYETLDIIKKDYSNGNNCKIKKFYTDENLFNKIKELYFHSEILYWIKLKNKKNFYFDKEFYEDYLNKCSDFYNKKIKDNYCKEFKYYEKELESFSNNFNEIIKFLEGKEINITKEEIRFPLKEECPSEEQSTSLEEQAREPAQNGKEMEYDTSVSNPGFIPMVSPDADTNVNAGIVSGAFAGISLLSLFFWKFTSLGSRIQHKIWKIKNNHNLKNETDEIIVDTSEIEDMYSYNNEYNIHYSSA
ncbi:PIR Superfamily Protein [Plasmodium ovale curtisi]|uniref:PIR Superfamily Protein n=1 Tax=Plasmodium ovale curtisi TaxID=864141 RepID=A0A1A8VNC6_PLAOA|nr:PIR Superfamily Protein [Plasmodium ovale curtisi]